MSVNWRQPGIYIAINDKSQGSIAKHFGWDTLLHYKLSHNLLVKDFLKSANILAKLQTKWLIVSAPHSSYTFVLKDVELAR